MTVNWSELRDAFGPADEVPHLLEQISPDPDDEVWGELWGRICHQGTVYTATFAALPVIVEKAASSSPEERLMPLILCSEIVSSRHGSASGEASADVWRPLLPTLLRLTEESIASGARDRRDAFHLLAAWVAFLDLPGRSFQVRRLADEELEGECPDCQGYLLVAIGEQGYFTAADDYVTKENVPRRDIAPASVGELSELQARIFAMARGFNDPLVDRALLSLFGSSHCPTCSKPLEIWSATAAEAGLQSAAGRIR